MTAMHRAAFVLSNILFFNFTSALACDPIDLNEAYDRADNVFVALLFRVQQYDDASKFQLVFDVLDVLKGPYQDQDPDAMLAGLTAPVEIWSDPPSYFPVNERYLLFLTDFQEDILDCGQVIRLDDYSLGWYEHYKKGESVQQD
jgi:hypothetical protein